MYRKSILFIKRDETELLDKINELNKLGQPIPDTDIENWTESGLGFRSTPEGVRAMHIAEVNNRRSTASKRKPSSLKFSAIDLYIQAGTERSDVAV